MDDRERRLAVAADEIDLRTWCNSEAATHAKRADAIRHRREPVSSAEHAATLDSYAKLLRRIGGMDFMARTLLEGLE